MPLLVQTSYGSEAIGPYEDATGSCTDVVAAEETRAWKGFPRSGIQPVGPRRAEHVPLHLLGSRMQSPLGVRMYSSSSSSSDDREKDSVSVSSGESETPADLTQDGSGAEFASLRGLFGGRNKTWTRSSEPSSMRAIYPSNPASMNQDSATSYEVGGDSVFDSVENLEVTEGQKSRGGLDTFPSVLPSDTKVEAARMTFSRPEPRSADDKIFEMPYIGPIADAEDTASSAGNLDDKQAIQTDDSNGAEQSVPLVRYHDHQAWKIRRDEKKKIRRAQTQQPQQQQPKPLPPWVTEKSDAAPLPSLQRLHASKQKSGQSPTYNTPRDLNENVKSLPAEGVTIAEPSGASQPDIPSNRVTTAPASSVLTHLTSTGEAHMVDVGQKQPTHRIAVATGFLSFSNPEAIRLIEENSNKKGDVLGTARIAGIMAAKRCSDIIPLCHPITIDKVTVHVDVVPARHRIQDLYRNKKSKEYGNVFVEARVHCHGKTGIEMEALTAVQGALLTVYDMCKAVDKNMTIVDTMLIYKSGGKSTYAHSSWTWRQKNKEVGPERQRLFATNLVPSEGIPRLKNILPSGGFTPGTEPIMSEEEEEDEQEK